MGAWMSLEDLNVGISDQETEESTQEVDQRKTMRESNTSSFFFGYESDTWTIHSAKRYVFLPFDRILFRKIWIECLEQWILSLLVLTPQLHLTANWFLGFRLMNFIGFVIFIFCETFDRCLQSMIKGVGLCAF